MATPLNLTLKRGPSVWDTPQKQRSDWRVYGVATGAALASMAMRPRANRLWLMGLAFGVLGACLFADRLTSTITAAARRLGVRRGAGNDSVVDRGSEDSFPASDPTQIPVGVSLGEAGHASTSACFAAGRPVESSSAAYASSSPCVVGLSGRRLGKPRHRCRFSKPPSISRR